MLNDLQGGGEEEEPTEETAPTKCPDCDAELKENAKFCGECGASIQAAPTKCPDCDAELKENAKFCGECGADVLSPKEESEEEPEDEEAPKEEPEATSLDINGYAGTWATNNANYENGGLLLDITVNANNVVFEASRIQAPPMCYVATLKKTIAMSELKNPLSFPFDDDGWGNKGTITLNFCNNYIDLEVSDVIVPGNVRWGFDRNDTYQLFLTPGAHESMAEPAPQVHTLEEAKEIIYADIDNQIRNATISWSDADQLYYFTLSNNTGFTYYLDMDLTFYDNGTTAGYDEMYGTVENGYYYNILLNCSSWSNFEATYVVSDIYENGVFIG